MGVRGRMHRLGQAAVEATTASTNTLIYFFVVSPANPANSVFVRIQKMYLYSVTYRVVLRLSAQPKQVAGLTVLVDFCVFLAKFTPARRVD